jgi:hypothetical protein
MIFAHIAGLSEKLKNKIKEAFLNSDYIFQDLEAFTEKIIQDKNMIALIQRYEYYCEKAKSNNITKFQSKQFIKKSKEIERKMNFYWKNKINYYILNLINSTSPNKKIILIGYCNFFKNIRVFINIQTNIKLFVNITSSTQNNTDNFTKDIITSNLDNYRDDIINGTFNLDLLNPSHLIKKREITTNIYLKNGYDLKTWDQICKLLSISLQPYETPSILYFASKINYETKINLKKIIAYSDDWISLVSAIGDKNLIKGYSNDDENKPFVQEIIKNSLQKLNDSITLYIITNTTTFKPIFTKNYIYKYETNKPVQIYKKIKITNISTCLKKKGIKLIKKN